MREKRTRYTKYREKIQRLIKENEDNGIVFFDDRSFEEFGRYFLKTVSKEEKFPLYRYSSLYYNGEFSELDTLRLSSNGKLNDAFEGLPPNWYDDSSAEEYVQKVKNLCYIKCFTETNVNNLMWAHYADGFRGVCIEYDIRSIQDQVLRSKFFPVFYSKKRLVCIDKSIIVDYWEKRTNDDVISDAKGIFLQKAGYWKYEKEWRICHMNRDPDKLKEEWEFPYVSAVYIGPRTPENDIRMVVEKVKEYEKRHNTSLQVHQMKFDDSTYDLHPHQLF